MEQIEHEGDILASKITCTIGSRLLALAIIPALAACANGPKIQPGPVTAAPSAALGQQGYELEIGEAYVLRPADVIDIRVFREEGLNLNRVPISATGEISMPLVGTVTAAGQTVPQLEAQLERLLANRYLRDPDVAVNIVEYQSHLVTVEGGVETPGIYPFQPGTRLSGAIALAEGPDRTADTNQIAIIRTVAGGMQIAKFDYRAMQEGTMIDPVLHPGDRVVVGTDSLSVFWQDLLRALPAFGVFTSL